MKKRQMVQGIIYLVIAAFCAMGVWYFSSEGLDKIKSSKSKDEEQALSSSNLEIFYDGNAVSGKTITISEYGRFIIPLQKISIKNTGNNSVKDLSIKIHFSRELKKYSEMQPTGASELIHGWSINNSFLEGYVSLLEFSEKISLHPDDSWNRRYILVVNFDKRVTEIKSISAKLSVYFGANRPKEVDLILQPEKENE